MAVPPFDIAPALAIQIALQKRLRSLDQGSPMGSALPGASLFPPGRIPPVDPLPPIGGIRTQTHGVRLPGQHRMYDPLPRYG